MLNIRNKFLIYYISFFGIDLNVIDFFEDKKLKVIERIKKIKDNTLVDEKIFNKCKDLINKKRYVPYVYGNGIEW